MPGGLVPIVAEGWGGTAGGRRHTSVAMMPRRFTAAIISSGFLIEPASEQPALGVGHAGLVPKRHVPQHDRPVADRLGAGANALRRVERDAVGRDAEDVVGRCPRVAGDAPAIEY